MARVAVGGASINGAMPGTLGAFALASDCRSIRGEPKAGAVMMISAGHVMCADPMSCHRSLGSTVSASGDDVAQHLPGHLSAFARHDIGFAEMYSDVSIQAVPIDLELFGSENTPTGEVADEIYIGSSVWKLGAISGLTRGRIVSVSAVRLRCNEQVLELDVANVVSDDGEPFSLPGDSGSMVYYQSGHALGVLVGERREDQRFFVSPLAPAVSRILVTGGSQALPETTSD